MVCEENNKRKEEDTTTCNFEIFQKRLGVEDFLEENPYFEEVRPNCKRTSDSGWVPPNEPNYKCKEKLRLYGVLNQSGPKGKRKSQFCLHLAVC